MHIWRSLVIYALLLLETAMACPPNCVCKWKGGKQTVECVNKSLQSVPEGVDVGTQVLDFTGNNLRNLSADQFQSLGIVNLQKIYLSRCRLVAVDERAFGGLSNLVELDLSNNILPAVPEPVFRHVPALMKLNLNGNPFKRVRAFAFKTLKYLVSLELSRCQLEAIERDAFYGLSALELLKLDFNALAFVAGAHTLPRRLHGISLQHNPWHCDCRLADLYAWLNASNVSQAVEPVCDGPTRLRGAPIKLLDEQELACAPDVSPTSLYVEIAEGKNVSLLCRVKAAPAARVSWRFGDRPLQNDTAVAPGLHLYFFVEEGGVEKRSELFIYNANADDNGTFVCVAENQAGRAHANYTVRIVLKEEQPAGGAPAAAKRLPVEWLAVAGVVAAAAAVALLVAAVATCALRRRLARRRRRKKAKHSKELVALYADGGVVADGRAPSPITRGSGETLSTVSGDAVVAGLLPHKSNGSIFIADQSLLRVSSPVAAPGDAPSPAVAAASAGGGGCASRVLYAAGGACHPFSAPLEPNPDLINDTGVDRKSHHAVGAVANAVAGESKAAEKLAFSTLTTTTTSTPSSCADWSTVGGGAGDLASRASTGGVINLPFGLCFNHHFQTRDLHLATAVTSQPDKFVVNAYPTDFGLPKVSTHFAPILPATAFYRTLPHRRHNAAAAAAATTTAAGAPAVAACVGGPPRYVHEAEFMTRSTQPASYEHFLGCGGGGGGGGGGGVGCGDVRYNVEGYPKNTPLQRGYVAAAAAFAPIASPAATAVVYTPHVSFSDTVQILGRESDGATTTSTSGTAGATVVTRADGKIEHRVGIALVNSAVQTRAGDGRRSSMRTDTATCESGGGVAVVEPAPCVEPQPLLPPPPPRLSVCANSLTVSPDEGYVGIGLDTTEV